tara:strand:+ start:2730 stop:3578 length:849 start_codon:yes stop_codon:yes gene_type:complete
MKTVFLFLILILLILLRISLNDKHKVHQTYVYNCGNTDDKTKNERFGVPPKTICMTIKNKQYIPQYIHEQYKKYASGYKIEIFDDYECKEFLRKEYGDSYVKRFDGISEGAHKADLFRYAYLFKKGGLYLDIKTLLLKNLDEIFNKIPTNFIMIKTTNSKSYDIINDNGSIYNGIIYTYPGNVYIKALLMDAMYGPPINNYERFIKAAHEILMDFTLDKHVNFGYIKTDDSISDVYILQEDFFKIEHCGELDRRQTCSFITHANTNEKLFKTRDSKYTPNYN